MPPVQQRYFASPVSFTWKHSAVKQLPRLWTVTKGPGCPCMLSLPGDGRDADRAEDGRGLRGRWRAIINVDRQVASRASADARVHVILGGTCAAISAWGLGFSRPGCSSTWGGGGSRCSHGAYRSPLAVATEAEGEREVAEPPIPLANVS